MAVYQMPADLKLIHFTEIMRLSMEQRTLKNVNNCWNTNIYSYLETSGDQSSNLYLNFVHFFQRQWYFDICGSLRQLFSCIGVSYVLFFLNCHFGNDIILVLYDTIFVPYSNVENFC